MKIKKYNKYAYGIAEFKVRTKESDIVKSCIKYLQAKQYFVMRCNTGIVETKSGSYFKQGVKGMADILCIKPFTHILEQGWFMHYWIECKTITGKQSDFQKQFQQDVEARGHKYILVRSLDELIAEGL
jgi:hypothetical protein